MGSKNEKQKKKYKSKNKSSDPPPPAHDRANHEAAGKLITDSRFASAHSDPRFQKVPKHKSKVAIDSRFDRMFSDKSFKTSSARLDKRGKPKKRNLENPLRHYYRIEENKEEKERGREDSDTEEEDEEDEEEDERELGKLDLGGKSEESEDEMESEESESTTDTDEEDDDVVYEEEENEVKENVPVIEKETRRLAIVNMDWRHVKAVDLYVVLSSFLPKDGQILSIAVYPSEFGLQRMKEEEVRGPIGLFDDENEKNDEGSDDDNDEIDSEKLRAYEKSRLRYYYAVMECDSIATADYLYKTCDGVEFERSSNVLDLRFIPDSMEFKHPPRDVATEAPANYEGLNFQSRALQQSKIHLTWDEDEPDRVKTLKRKFNADQLAELELKEFLASDGSESDDDQKRDKYRALVESGDGSDRDGEDDGQDMEVTFNTGLEDISKRILEKKDKISETVWEAYLRKKREKKKARKNKSQSSDDESSDTDQEAIEEPDDFFVEEPSVKKGKKEARDKSGKGKQHQDANQEAEASRAELELLLADDNGEDTGLKGYNMKPKKVKGKKRKEVPNEDKIPAADYDDPRFSALFTSHLYALDPTEPQFKRSAAYARQVAQKQQKGDQQEFMERKHMKLPRKAQLPSDEPETNKAELAKSNKEKYELSSLVRSIKMKSKQVQKLPSEGKMSKKKR